MKIAEQIPKMPPTTTAPNVTKSEETMAGRIPKYSEGFVRPLSLFQILPNRKLNRPILRSAGKLEPSK